MLNTNKLRGVIVERGMTIDKLATEINIAPSTFHRKLSDVEKGFTIGEVDLIAKILNLSATEATSIFLSQYVA